jgi:RHS repeat-associated protein
MPVDITGTATDANFLRYRLELSEVDAATATVIGSGSTAVVGGVLGRLDPTLLENGLYRVRLVVEDVNGQVAADERVYRVDGLAKIGFLALSFIDLQVPIAGIPIEVIRSYDSRVKASHDFGVGWSLDIRSGKYQHNRTPGQGWTINDQPFLGGALPCIGGATETQPHITEVRLSDRESYTFGLELSSGHVGFTGACEATARFRFLDGTTPDAQLEILGGTSVLYPRGGPDRVLDTAAFLDGREEVYNPRQVRLTTKDGRRIELQQAQGITRIEDLNGNALSINPGGLVHSTGKSIAFNRDASGRITRITDPLGHHLKYSYDSAGDLVEFVDQASNRTMMRYDANHYLTDIHDALGTRAAHNEYDSDGRLIAIVDVRGRRVEFAHNIADREEIVTDTRGNARRLLYDEMGYLRSEQRLVTRDGVQVLATTTFVHDARGNELVEIDADGIRTEAIYDASGNAVEEVLDPSGLALRATTQYDARLRPLAFTNPAGETTTMSYDARGNLTRFTDATGHATRLEVDGRGRPTRVTDPAGLETRVTHDAFGNALREERADPSGAVLRRDDFTYDANGNLLTSTVWMVKKGVLQPLTTRYAYDALNRVTKVTDPAGSVSATEYNALGLETARVDAMGRRTQMTYDEFGALIRTEFPDGTAAASEYDSAGNLVRWVDRHGAATSYEYDELNRRVRKSLPDGTSQRTVYSLGGLVEALIDASGNRTDFAYDSAGRNHRIALPAVFDALAGVERRPEMLREFDRVGRRSAAIDALGRRTEFSYDAAGRLVRTTFADGTTREERYDSGGRRTERQDEDGRVTTFEHDALGRLIAVRDPLGARTTYRYDEADNLLAGTDALGRTTAYQYDAVNRLVGRTLPGGEHEGFTYDEAGNILSHTDFNGAGSTRTYDTMNRLVSKTFDDGSEVKFTYTASGQRASATDARGTTLYAYDAMNRPVRVTQPTGDTIDYAYDGSGRLRTLTTSAQTVSYEYDALHRLTRIVAPVGETRHAYDAAGNPVQTTLANGVITRRVYDPRHRLTEIRHTLNGTTLASFAYQLSRTGRRVRASEANGDVETYTYDLLDRLQTEVRAGTRAIGYQYDAVGNRTHMNRDGFTTTYTYDLNDRLLSAGDTSFTYDANGNVLSQIRGGAVTTYAWDFENRLVSAAGAAGESRFDYDVDGNRVGRETNGSLTRLLVDTNSLTGFAQVLEERNAVGGLVASYTLGSHRYSTNRRGTISFYLADGLESTRLLTDPTGSVTDTYDYDGYGSLTHSSGSSENPYRFAGEHFDVVSGFYDLRARSMDPIVGRFISRDPFQGILDNPLTMHPYLYAEGDPINLRDPSGYNTLIEQSQVSTIVSILVRTAQPILKAINTAETAYDILTAVYTVGNILSGNVGFPDNIEQQFAQDLRQMALPDGDEAAAAFEANARRIIERVADQWRKYLITTMSSRDLRVKQILLYMPSPGGPELPPFEVAKRFRGMKRLSIGIVFGGDINRLYGAGLKIGPAKTGSRGIARQMFRGVYDVNPVRRDTPNDWTYANNARYRFVVSRPPSN